MEADEAINKPNLPAPMPKSARGKYRVQKKEKQLMLLEAAANAYVLMENGEYKYGDQAHRMFDKDGNPAPNTRELMRLAGYSRGSLDKYPEYLEPQDEFWKLIELYRIRRTDPRFGKGREGELWQEVGNESLKYLYEVTKYTPHSLSVEQHIKIVKLILDAGISLQKIKGGETGKTKELLSDLSPEQREKIMSSYENNLRKELDEVERSRKAAQGADLESV
jgi:hypothetical protein